MGRKLPQGAARAVLTFEVQLPCIYHNSLISRTATGIVIGFGAHGYELALDAMGNLLSRAG
jgi:3-dehydroquinate dehydratase